MRKRAIAIVGWLAAASAGLGCQPAPAADHAVVLMYQRVGESRHPTTSVRLDQFVAQLRELASGRYSVLPLTDIIDRLRAGQPLRDRTVAITVDDGYVSFLRRAWPRLKKAGLPVTLMLATEPIDRHFAGHLTWPQIRELVRQGVTIGAQTHTHRRLLSATPAEVRAELAKANARIEAETGQRPVLFAYPYGEWSLAVRELVREAGYAAAFSDYSGVVHGAHDLLALPRFAVNEAFGGIDRFRLILNALPLPVTDAAPAEPPLAANPPAIAFTVAEDVTGLERLACYLSPQRGALPMVRLERRVELRLSRPLPPGQSRINCTAPADGRRWRWHGMLLVAPAR